jgi:hypothetical protein
MIYKLPIHTLTCTLLSCDETRPEGTFPLNGTIRIVNTIAYEHAIRRLKNKNKKTRNIAHMEPVNTATITFSTSPPVYPFSSIIFAPNHIAKE